MSLLTVPLSLKANPFSLGQEKSFVINNRVVGVVNGKPLTVIDVLKKMDVIFYKQFPEYRNNPMAKAQFYQASFKNTLQQLIDKELIVADAEESKLEVSHGDVRQEMETIFGPNVLDNLDRIGLSFDEAWQIVKDDIVLKRMMYFRVHMKAIKQVTPQMIQEAYLSFSEKNKRKDEWRYQIVTIKGEKCEEIAKEAKRLLKEETPIDQVVRDLNLHLSQEYVASLDELSTDLKPLISSLKVKEFTDPILQKSRKSEETFFKIFVLNGMREAGAPPLAEVEHSLLNQLIEQTVAKETEKYLKRLHTHFGYKESESLVGEDFQPIAFG
jgi:hypothetical protein